MRKKSNNTFSLLQTLSGPISIPLTNDYSFRALLQKNQRVLKGLICALLHLNSKDITSIRILNPIVLGDTIDNKTFIMDILIKLNDSSLINLELQVINQHNWTDRSLIYLCRAFDQLNKGEDYISCNPAIQIGILDFTLFPEYPEFFATYKLQNIKTGQLYSDKFTIHVLDLNHTYLATGEDVHYKIDYWAKLFKAKTWEDMRMLAKKDEIFEDAAHTIYEISQDDMIRMQIQAREDFNRDQRAYQHWVEEQNRIQKQALEKVQSDLTETQEALKVSNSSLAETKEALKVSNSSLAETKEALKVSNSSLAETKEALKASENEAARLKQLLIKHGINTEE